jgi:hypothetical protein
VGRLSDRAVRARTVSIPIRRLSDQSVRWRPLRRAGLRTRPERLASAANPRSSCPLGTPGHAGPQPIATVERTVRRPALGPAAHTGPATWPPSHPRLAARFA